MRPCTVFLLVVTEMGTGREGKSGARGTNICIVLCSIFTRGKGVYIMIPCDTPTHANQNKSMIFASLMCPHSFSFISCFKHLSTLQFQELIEKWRGGIEQVQ